MLPKSFIFGAATAAYQVEGAANGSGRGMNLWDEYYHSPMAKFNADQASDFYHQYPHDLALGKAYGLQAIRISIEWSRIFPHNNHEVNQAGVDYYHHLIDECLNQGIHPLVTLHHFDSPKWVYDKGDFLSRSVIDDYLVFAELCFREYGTKVQEWATFNETYVYASDKFIIGEEPPFAIGCLDKAFIQMYHMTLAHARAVLLYKSLNLPGQIGIVHVLQPKYPFDQTVQADRHAAMVAEVWYSRWMLEYNFQGQLSAHTRHVLETLLNHYGLHWLWNDDDDAIFVMAKGKTDFLGVNYYAPAWFKGVTGTSEIKHNSDGTKGSSKLVLGGIGESCTPDNIPRNDWDWAIYPAGLTDVLCWIAHEFPNYHKIYITENGVGYKETLDSHHKVYDYERIAYLADHLQAVEHAIKNGVNVMGYYIWSWMDMFSWTNGYNKRYGLFFVDYATQHRYPKLSAAWYHAVIQTGDLKVDLKAIENRYTNDEVDRWAQIVQL